MKSQLFDLSKKNIKKSVETQTLQLDFRQKISHYQSVLVLFYLSALFTLIPVFFAIKNYFSEVNTPMKTEIIWVSPFFLATAIIYYFVQKSRLRLTALNTTLSREQIGSVIDDICKEFNWSKWRNRKDLIVLRTPEEFWSFFAAEQITILFGSNVMFVNSIRDLDARRKAFGEVGKNAENLEIVRDKIQSKMQK